MQFLYPEGATPLDADEAHALIPGHLSTQNELNEWEQFNIYEAEKWIFQKGLKQELTSQFCVLLHKKMFSQTWKWAGDYRKTVKNIGVEPCQISQQLFLLCGDVGYQLQHNAYSTPEIAARLHHRMVAIHPFVNGNGRHARLLADWFLMKHGEPRFSWGKDNLSTMEEIRRNYIQALRQADQHNYEPLYDFLRIEGVNSVR